MDCRRCPGCRRTQRGRRNYCGRRRRPRKRREKDRTALRETTREARIVDQLSAGGWNAPYFVAINPSTYHCERKAIRQLYSTWMPSLSDLQRVPETRVPPVGSLQSPTTLSMTTPWDGTVALYCVAMEPRSVWDHRSRAVADAEVIPRLAQVTVMSALAVVRLNKTTA